LIISPLGCSGAFQLIAILCVSSALASIMIGDDEGGPAASVLTVVLGREKIGGLPSELKYT